ncbi:MAG TPA: M48 family metallopeptidase [Geobacteraceae bacterium]
MKVILLIGYLLTASAGYLLRALNLRHLKRHGAEVPAGFEGAVDRELLARTAAYTVELSRVGLVASLVDNIVLLLFIFGGLLGAYDRWIASLGCSFVTAGVLFFAGISLAGMALDIPFNAYSTFRIENRYGFNTTSARLWLADLAKSACIGLFLLALLSCGALAIVHASPRFWWLWVWLFSALTTLFTIYLAPYVIEPLFNTFEPVRDEGVEEEIRTLLAKAGLSVSRVLQVDASRRSRHSNAYFTGIGRVKRIVLYDTLLQQMRHGEILSILAHEAGHWKRGHIRKRLLFLEAGGLAFLYVAFRLLAWGGLPGLVGLSQASFAGQAVILAFVGSLAAFPFSPLGSWLSRRHEWEADRFACDLTGAPEDLATALIKLSRENLANLHPHPLYARFYYSHPPVVERVRRLREKQEN